MHIRMLFALAYVPTYDIVCVFEELIGLASFPEVEPLLNYFEDTFLGRQRQRRRVIARFSAESGISTKLLGTTLLV
jgi:hypothetical protein